AVAKGFYNGPYEFSVYLGEGYGFFGEPVNYSITNSLYGFASGDFNKDDNIDLAVSCHGVPGSTLDIFLGYGNGSFGPKWSLDLPINTAENLVTADFNNDSFLDLAIVSDTHPPGVKDHLAVLFGNGEGRFYVDEVYTSGYGYWCIDVVACDFNLDGFIDLAVTNYDDADIRVFYNNGNGKFTFNQNDYYTGSKPISLDTGDFNMDGFPDLAVTLPNEVSILINDGTGGFNDPLLYDVGHSSIFNDLVIDDFTGDNILDLVVTNKNDDDVTFLRGYGNGIFWDRQDFYAFDMPVGIACGNFNPIPTPDLNCSGNLSWTNVTLGDIVTDSFTVKNDGSPFSLLDWEISEYPNWGTWTFVPESGNNLTPEDGPIVVEVSVVAPDEEDSFTGEVKVVNKNDDNDYCTIDVSLSTLKPPNPPIIDGPPSGKAGNPYTYTFTSTDPDGDDVSYYIKWGDGEITDWTAFQASGPPGYSE
ncbi:MAG: FG-GAP repeat domain-containing protein, partial [Candidatus Hodarchaeota archaeon]